MDITLHREALALYPPGHPDRSKALSKLVLALQRRYDQTGRNEDVEECISLYHEALALRPSGHPDRSMFLNNLAVAHNSRFKQSGKTEDLEASITFHCEALALRPSGHPDRSISLNNLAVSLDGKYAQLGKVEDLDSCIALYREALALRLPGHPDRSTLLNNLAAIHNSRYEQLGQTEDLNDCITFHHDALALRPPGHPDRFASLNNLAASLNNRYYKLGRIDDLEHCITLHREGLALCPPGHRTRCTSLNNLAVALKDRYAQLGKKDDLDESITCHREALIFCPLGHPSRSVTLNNLAIALRTRYSGQWSRIDDLDDCITFHCQVLPLRPPGHPDRHISLNNLAVALKTRYAQLGKINDLEDCISFHCEVLALYPPGHPHRPTSLSNLALALSDRYVQLGKSEDLEDCMTLNRDALALRPLGHPDRLISLNNLALALRTRYAQLGKREDLEVSVTFFREALDLCPPGKPDRCMSLNNLAAALSSQYALFGKREDLEDSITLNRDALSLRPPGHSDRSQSLSNLALALSTRYATSNKIEDIDDCITYHCEGLDFRPPGNPDRSSSLKNLALALTSRYAQLRAAEDLQRAFTSFEHAASDPTSYLKDRLSAAVAWAHTARSHQHHSTLAAYKTALHLLHRSLISRPSVELQHEFLATATTPRSLACDAASAAIEAGNLELGVELLEQGRAMLWSKANTYKYPLEQLRQVEGGGELAARLQALNAELETLVLLSNRSTTLDKVSTSGVVNPSDARTRQHRLLSEEWEEVVGRIRELQAFSNFLHAPPFDTLQSAAADGPVILINISRYRSDAIILLTDNPPTLVPLPLVRPDELDKQAQKRNSNREIVGVLRFLWHSIVSPIVDRLSELGIPKKSRIWWCPTAGLCALPLHAAGPYGVGKKNLPDLYTSSYISTLSSLIKARSNIAQPPTTPKLLVVGHPSESQKLERVKAEVSVVKEFGPENIVDVLFESDANCEAVLEGLRQHSWVHFACHGHLGENSKPFQASFELHDGRRLPLLDLIQARIPNAELAFLSACHSAEGDSRTPDESIHLSAALQFCGFRSVVGTLWEMDDEDGPMISEAFYKYMFRDPGKIDFRDSAHALSSAVRTMRKAKLPPERWVMFAHIGA